MSDSYYIYFTDPRNYPLRSELVNFETAEEVEEWLNKNGNDIADPTIIYGEKVVPSKVTIVEKWRLWNDE